MAKTKRCGVKDIQRHINRFLNKQLGENDEIDFYAFKGKTKMDRSKTGVIVNDNGKVIKIPVIKGHSRQLFVASLLNDDDKPFEHLNGDLASKMVNGYK